MSLFTTLGKFRYRPKYYNTNARPRYDTTTIPRYDTTTRPRYDTTTRPRYDTTTMPKYSTHARPRYDTNARQGSHNFINKHMNSPEMNSNNVPPAANKTALDNVAYKNSKPTYWWTV